MKYIETAVVSFAVGVAFARLFWAQAIAKGKEELARIEAAIKSKFDPVKQPPAPPAS